MTRQSPTVLAFGASMLVHASFVASLALVGARAQVPKAGLAELSTPHLELEIVEDDDPEYDPPDEAPAERVVDAPETDETGEHAETPRFAAGRTTFAKRETRARVRIVSPDRVTSSEPSAPGATDAGEIEPPGPRAGNGVVLMQEGRREARDSRESNGLLAFRVPGVGSGAQGLGGAREPGPPGPPGLPGPPQRLRPTLGDLRHAIRGTGLEDLEDVEEGERTALNAVEWRHAPFFNRVQSQVEQYWRPGELYAEHDPTGHIYGYRDRETIIKVILNPDGTLRNAYVIEESGATFLDDVAREAIERAAPFPRPPRGLLDPDSQVVAFRFSFTVQVHEAPVVRMQQLPQ